MGQWQELELQALIYRHMLTGTAIPPELLHLLLKKSLLNSPPPSPSPSPSSYYQLPHPLQHYPNLHPALLQSGYWGRGAMDPEPGRCRRTDGKKWRCSRDVVAGHKYCERHVHRGRNRSRKPVEIPTPTSTTNIPMTGRGGGGGSEVLKTTNATHSIGGSDNPFLALAGGGSNHFALSGHSPSFDLLHLSQRNHDSMIENKSIFRSHAEMPEDVRSGGRILRHFFDDWPRSIHEQDNTSSSASSLTSATSLSISVPENPSSDFSLKLSTGDGDELGAQEGNGERERLQLNWGMAWGSNPVASMGGPLAEALRSSRSNSNSSPTSVLHQLQRGSTSETTSYISI